MRLSWATAAFVASIAMLTLTAAQDAFDDASVDFDEILAGWDYTD